MFPAHYRIILVCLELIELVALGGVEHVCSSKDDLRPGEYVSQSIDPSLSKCTPPLTSASITLSLAETGNKVNARITIDGKPLVTKATLYSYTTEMVYHAIIGDVSNVKCHWFKYDKKRNFIQAYRSLFKKCGLDSPAGPIRLVLCGYKGSGETLDLYLEGRTYGKKGGKLRFLKHKISFMVASAAPAVPHTAHKRRSSFSVGTDMSDDKPLKAAAKGPDQEYSPTIKKKKTNADEKSPIENGVYIGVVPAGDVGISAVIQLEDGEQLITVTSSVNGAPGPRIDNAVLVKAEDYPTSGCFKLEGASTPSMMRMKPSATQPPSLDVDAGDGGKYTLHLLTLL
ncbi:hypothetical protein FOL47_004832 [Perkinsus chesapeaki]|uniref:Uncharacterized protein n=1 Tax=Perkinsus chesapeaki TaxID=330153 RepID=A0A7J6M0D8_PERCH|nr:hypothetical protein FOL47_004832 [Perkinsus chesapeaki]